MTAIWRAKFFMGTLLTALMITLSYEVKITTIPIPPYLLIILSFIISTYLANIFVKFSLGFKIGRRIIMNKAWIEGHWYLTTTQTLNHPNAVSQAGIVYISYEGDNYVLSVITYRRKTDDMNTGLSSLSELVTIRDFDLKFSNLFSISNGSIDTGGVTVGKFFSDSKGGPPNRFEGHVVLFNEGINRRQSGTKIPQKEVSNLIKEHGDFWKDEFLKQKATALHNVSAS